MNQRPLLSVIIVSYNTRAMTLECLEVLRTALGALPAETILVDNASQDGSVAAVREAFPEVRVIASERNLGFGAANNVAMAEAAGEFFLLLNSDAFPKGDALPVLVEYLRSHPRMGAAGPRLLNRDGSLQVSCWKFPSPVRSWLEGVGLAAAFPRHPQLGDYYRWAHDEERTVDFVIGACLLVRRQVLATVGGFDERFFMYAEETDWQKRMHKHGWEVGFTPRAEVTHLGGASGHGAVAPVNSHFFRSMDLYLRKHHGVAGLLAARVALALGSAGRALFWLGRAPRRADALPRARRYGALALRQATCWKGIF